MGLFDFFGGSKKQLASIEERLNQVDQYFNGISGNYPYINNLGTYTPGVDYDGGQMSAMRISTYFTCLLVRAEAWSTLPGSVMQDTDKGPRTAYENAAYQLIHNKPNPFQNACDFWKSVSAHIDNCGNCYAIISYSGRFQPSRIDLVENPSSVVISRTDAGNKLFIINGKVYKDWEVLHFKDLSLDGVYGCSKIEYNASTLGYAKNLRKYGTNAIGVKPPGYFSTDQGYDAVKKAEEAISKSWKDGISGGGVPLLPFGLKYNPLMISPDDAQYLDAIGATKEDIYGFMRVPPALAQNYEHATYANAEQQDLVFVKYTMLPLITNVEQECNSKLFAEGNAESKNPYYVKFNVNAFMRGDFRTRTDGYRTLIQTGVMSVNDVARLEDWPQVEGGDERYLPMNLIPLSQQKEFIKKLSEPVPTNVGDAGGGDNAQKAGRSEDILNALGIIYNTTKKNGHTVNGNGN